MNTVKIKDLATRVLETLKPQSANLKPEEMIDAFIMEYTKVIVTECASICDQQSRVSWNDDRKEQARMDRDLIKDQFGV